MKNVVIVGAVIVVVGLMAYLFIPRPDQVPTPATTTTETSPMTETESTTMERTVVTPGAYTVNTNESRVSWAGKKPLLDGYINDGSLALQSGDINVASDSASGSFTIDMNTLSVSNTPTKPGSESMLAEHLMSDRWFDVEQFPTATYEIISVTPRADSDTTFVYDVEGTLTMKGVTNPLSFPATIYQNSNGQVVAEASTEFDRTLWDITAGSASFFDNMADNAIDNMVALSFRLVADGQ